jgi:NitT/TauT family transport system ATP-binding protein
MRDRAFRLERASRWFGDVEVLRELSLEICRGEFVAVVGPSGCGKTTLLNVLSGYDGPSSGVIEREGRERMVYQQDGLFPWQTVSQNIALGLRHLKDQSERERQVRDLLDLIRLEGFENHYPHQLSGGMRQRVELARALAGDSETLLMDEPFSSLDYLTRIRMRQELARILQKRPRTVVLVTHDIEEAAQLADRVIVLTDRPARIRCELTIREPRPRGLTDPEVVRAIDRLLVELGIQGDGDQGDRDRDGAGHRQTNCKEE